MLNHVKPYVKTMFKTCFNHVLTMSNHVEPPSSPNMSALELGSFWHRFMIPKPHSFHRPLLGAKKAPAAAVLHPWDENAFINILAALWYQKLGDF